MTSSFDYDDFADLIHKCRHTLVVRHFIALGKKLGWQEETNRGKGSHIAMIRAGYAPVEIPCHGRGATLGKGIAHQILSRLLQPLNEEETEALSKSQQETWEAWFVNEQVRFQNDAQVELQNLLAQVGEHINVYETERLAEAERLALQLAQEQGLDQSNGLEMEMQQLQGLITAQQQQLQQMEVKGAMQAQEFQHICDRYQAEQLRTQASLHALQAAEHQLALTESYLAQAKQKVQDVEARWLAQQQQAQQQEETLVAERQQLQDLARQLKLARRRQKNALLMLWLSAIATTAVVCSPAPTWVKGLSVLAIPPLCYGVESWRR